MKKLSYLISWATILILLTSCTKAQTTSTDNFSLEECAKKLPIDLSNWEIVSKTADEISYEPGCHPSCEPGMTIWSCYGYSEGLVVKRTGNSCELIRVGKGSAWNIDVHCPTPIGDPILKDVVGIESGATAIALGDDYTCAIVTGGVKCWGNDFAGQLGNGRDEERSLIGDVVGLGESVSAIALGEHHTCALTDSGGVKCWGYNLYGQLGNGKDIESGVPVDVSGLESGVTAITAGGNHACALIAGKVKCWGQNDLGQLGNGTEIDSKIPIDVTGIDSGFTAIEAGSDHTCAITSSGGVKCWGANYSGQLGTDKGIESRFPIDVTGLMSGVKAISAGGSHTCALLVSGKVKCWGDGEYAALGTGNYKSSQVPVDVVGLNLPVTSIAAGYLHTCALTTAGEVLCWGWNADDQLGGSSEGRTSKPFHVDLKDSRALAIATGYSHTCALLSSSSVKCWGSNDSGQLGNR